MIKLDVQTTTGINSVYLSPDDRNKYMVLTCAKNEDKYLIEFIEHYLKIGFDKVIIADNNDEPTIEKILEKYIQNGTVQILNFRGYESFQVQLYAAYAGLGNYEWCGFFDADEFLEIKAYSSIKTFLKTIKENCVSFHWINFGTNGEAHYNSKPIQERFPLPVMPIAYFKENVFMKSIVRGGDCWKGCWFNGSHIPYFVEESLYYKNVYNIGGYSVVKDDKHSFMHCRYPLKYKIGYVKHYYTKSFEEWIVKSSRGWPDGTPSLSSSTFLAFNKENNFDFDKYIYAAFGPGGDYYKDIAKNNEFYKKTLDEYSVIHFSNESHLVYSVILSAIACMKITTNHTFIFTDDHIDDTAYTMLLECGFYTGNNVVFCRNQEEVWNTYLKYHNKNENTYYIIND